MSSIKFKDFPDTVSIPSPPVGFMAIASAAGEVYKKDPTGIATPWGTATAPILISNSTDNSVINGDFDFWQRGTTLAVPFSSASSPTYLADRWSVITAATGAGGTILTYAQSADVPDDATTGHNSVFSLLATNAQNITLLNSEFVGIRQTIEGFNFASLAEATITVSFFCKSSVAGEYALTLSRADSFSFPSYNAPFTINLANTWEYKTIDIDMAPGTALGGPWLFDETPGLSLTWVLGSDVSLHAPTPNTWINLSHFGLGTSQTTWITTVSATFQLSQVQFSRNTGDFFIARHPGLELLLCQRYYEKTMPVDVNPVDGAAAAGAISSSAASAGRTPGLMAESYHYSAEKRVVPTLVFLTPISGAPASSWRSSSGLFVTASTLFNGTSGLVVQNAANTTANLRYDVHAVANSEF